VTIKGFEFDKKLMEEHFNEKYMESDKYPYATFSGKVNETIDYTKNGTYKVTLTGKLDMHGVVKDRTIEGTVTIKDGEISFESKFIVALKDHNIEIPSIVAQNIAETVEVTIKTTLIEFKK
jgi:polyisoprenoid-binding protein YceI